jgi:hypothetical protein
MDWLWANIVFILISLYYIYAGRFGKIGKLFWIILLLVNVVLAMRELGVVSF